VINIFQDDDWKPLVHRQTHRQTNGSIDISKTQIPLFKRRTQEAAQCDKTRFSMIQPSIDVTGIRNERWQ